MKNPIPAFLLAVSSLCLPALAQKPGDSVTTEALGKLDWITGKAPDAWEPGQVYILECWATWCGPCIAAIPHVDALHDKYHAKGLNILGINVWEDGKDKVAEFVKAKGDGMSYPVAYTGKGGEFETQWLIPAGVRGIPHAFVVKDGKVLTTAHPSALTEEFIESILEGGDAETGALKRLASEKEKQEKSGGIIQAFRKAKTENDLNAMAASIDELKELDATSRYLPMLELELQVAVKDWQQAETALDKLPDTPARMMALTGITHTVLAAEEVSEEFLHKLIDAFAAGTDGDTGANPAYLFLLSKLQWKAGRKDDATTSARKAVDVVKKPQYAEQISSAPYERYAKALENGEMPTTETFSAWLREAMPVKD